jgi:hypothetical protein
MIPSRFATEYPERCLKLLGLFEHVAHEQDLLGTFSIMLASSILLVPLERAKNEHPIRQERGGGLQASLKRLERRKWLAADFWAGTPPGEWRFSRIMGDPNDVQHWCDEKGESSFALTASTMQKRRVGEVLRVLRNALAHGNIVYLNEHGHEIEGERVQYLAFLSRYEETEGDRERAETYRLVTVRETDFLPFIHAWGQWVVAHHAHDSELRVA